MYFEVNEKVIEPAAPNIKIKNGSAGYQITLIE